VTLAAWDEPKSPAGLYMSYADDGCGYEMGAAKSGIGTRSIQRRVADLGADFDFAAAQGSGVTIRLSIPSGAFQPAEQSSD